LRGDVVCITDQTGLEIQVFAVQSLVNRFTREGKSIYPVRKFSFCASQSAGKSIYLQGKSIYPVKNGIFLKSGFQTQRVS
jgi:ribosomal protein S3AE